jgi:hypothetical protein
VVAGFVVDVGVWGEVGEEIGEVAGVGGVEEGGEGWREFGGHGIRVRI